MKHREKAQTRWKRFSLRALLAITSLVCVAIAIAMRTPWYQQNRVIWEIKSLGGVVIPGFEMDAIINDKGGDVRERWDLVNVTLQGPSIGDEHVPLIKRVRGLTYVDLSDSRVTDSGVTSLVEGSSIVRFIANRTAVSANVFKELAKVESLDALELKETKIAGRGLHDISRMKSLRLLDLSGSDIGDEEAEALTRVKTLLWIDLSGTRVSSKMTERIRQSLPECQVLQVDARP